ncbi:MAG TPA: twin-arginine translocase TatA/TatE family subunit [Solirubrobacteraceae bacterium]|jgi:sec-independent protein translocase protein TatA|nr:twin-arginine translocase TatA/TatE family subunit [Solirubrobacteraceae bacterium]
MGLSNPIHIAFLLVILLLVFGAKRLPEMGRSLGEGLRGFKSSIEGEPAPSEIAPPATTNPAQDPQTVLPVSETAPATEHAPAPPLVHS